MKLIDPEYRIIVGTIGYSVILFIGIYSIITEHKVDSTIITTLGTSSTLLLGIGIIKKHKSFNE